MCQHHYKYALTLHYVQLIIYCVVVKMNLIQSNEYTSFWII